MSVLSCVCVCVCVCACVYVSVCERIHVILCIQVIGHV